MNPPGGRSNNIFGGVDEDQPKKVTLNQQPEVKQEDHRHHKFVEQDSGTGNIFNYEVNQPARNKNRSRYLCLIALN